MTNPCDDRGHNPDKSDVSSTEHRSDNKKTGVKIEPIEPRKRYVIESVRPARGYPNRGADSSRPINYLHDQTLREAINIFTERLQTLAEDPSNWERAPDGDGTTDESAEDVVVYTITEKSDWIDELEVYLASRIGERRPNILRDPAEQAAAVSIVKTSSSAATKAAEHLFSACVADVCGQCGAAEAAALNIAGRMIKDR